MQTAVVTGSSYGLGKAICAKLLANNYKVYGLSRSNPQIKNPHFIWLQTNLTDDHATTNSLQHIKETHLDLLVNNAGRVVTQKTRDYTDEAFEQTFDLNFKSPIKITLGLLPKLAGGLVINISSNSDRFPDPDFGLYGSSKAALNIFFETMAAENTDVKIINILPSYIDTPLLHTLFDQTDFDWNLCMSANEAAQSLVSIIDHQKDFASGSRVLVVKKEYEDGIYNPEKLWVYITSSGSAQKLYKD